MYFLIKSINYIRFNILHVNVLSVGRCLSDGRDVGMRSRNPMIRRLRHCERSTAVNTIATGIQMVCLSTKEIINLAS